MVQCEPEHGGCGEWYHTRCILDEIHSAVAASPPTAASPDETAAAAVEGEVELPDVFVCKFCTPST
tara:strand:+ start:283 stop:480 length:198 start_codon:yes stop_codon:yes gene_type:complete